jgi:alpha-L-rhamnosidase
LLVEGKNAVGLWLGSGFFGQNVAWLEDFDYGQPRARAKIFIEYTDGSIAEVGTDRSWNATTSPILFDNVYWGETYDARLEEISDWASVGCDTRSWQEGGILEAPCPDAKLAVATNSAHPRQTGAIETRQHTSRWSKTNYLIDFR